MKRSESYTIDIAYDTLTLLKGIPSEKRHAVLHCLDARVSHFEKGDILAGKARASSRTRYLVEGEAFIVRYDTVGNRSILGSYAMDSVIASELIPRFCEMNSLDIIAGEPCTTLDFSISQEVEGCPCCVKYINNVKGNLVNSLTEMNMQFIKRLDTLANRSTREKVLAYLQERADEVGRKTFNIPYNRQELADYLYIERSALSRELSKMQREGIISYDHNRFTLANNDLSYAGQ